MSGKPSIRATPWRAACLAAVLLPCMSRAEGTAPFLSGLDLSSVPEVEKSASYKLGGEPGDVFGILQAQGVNAARFRLWNDPQDGVCGLDEVARDAARAKAHGMAVMIDFHYSDSWADPQHQPKPKAWESLPLPDLCDAVQSFTHDAVARLAAQGTPPDLVQVGNEIRNGMLWPDGRVDIAAKSDPEALAASLERLSRLVRAGIAGVRSATPPGRHIGIVIHVDAGGYPALYLPVFEALEKERADYDAIGLSYYPGQQGTLAQLQAALAELTGRYRKPVYICETNYPFTGAQGRLDEFPPTPEGQAAFLKALVSLLRAVPENRGAGLFYWGGERILSHRPADALFDGDGNALLPGLRALVPGS